MLAAELAERAMGTKRRRRRTVCTLSSLALLLLLDACSAPHDGVREFELVAAPASVPLIDGRTMEFWAYNGRVPGPTLRVKLGETLRVRLTNRLPQPTTIHWHGVRVPNAMGGVPWVTQPPVEPGGTFVYEFAPKDAGTFWFHPHIRSSEQVERGLFGVLIVEEPDPPPFSGDEV
jgi:FtsP/CotA-like multicopper oxidase with cupredoxin domain